jgi:hypothetical protein
VPSFRLRISKMEPHLIEKKREARIAYSVVIRKDKRDKAGILDYSII